MGVIVVMGATRLMFYVFEWPVAHWLTRLKGSALSRLSRHPVVWDELGVWPLPAVHRLLTESLREGLEQSLALVCHIGANPFQMWAVQRGLSDFLLEHADPLSTFYQLAHLPDLDALSFCSGDTHSIPPSSIGPSGFAGRSRAALCCCIKCLW